MRTKCPNGVLRVGNVEKKLKSTQIGRFGCVLKVNARYSCQIVESCFFCCFQALSVTFLSLLFQSIKCFYGKLQSIFFLGNKNEVTIKIKTLLGKNIQFNHKSTGREHKEIESVFVNQKACNIKDRGF